jgi:GTPase SAR1 family protein
MPIEHIEEHENKEFPNIDPVKEVMDIYIPDVIGGVPNRNGFIWVLSGRGGSGKTSMLLNFFRRKNSIVVNLTMCITFVPAAVLTP